MKEVEPDKGLQDAYTEAEFDQAISDGAARQAGAVPESAGFSAEDARTISTITLLRIYDMLGAILTHLDEEMATALLEKHADGGIESPPPYLNI